MSSAFELLKQYYDTSINSKKDWGFFLGLADYFELIGELPELLPYLNKIFDEYSKDLEKIHKIEKKAIKELQEFKRDLLKMIKKAKIKKEGLKEAIKKLQDLEEGKINSGHFKSSRLDEGLRNLVKVLADNEEEFRKYPDFGGSKSYLERMTMSTKIKDDKEITIWGAYIKTREIFRLIKDYDNYLGYLRKNNQDTGHFRKIKEEIDLIKGDGNEYGLASFYFNESEDKKFSSSYDRRIKELKRDKYEVYFTRLHNFLLKSLSIPVKNKENNKTYFNKDKSFLFVGEKQISIRTFSDQYHLLRIIFEDKNETQKEWFFSEISERYDEAKNLPDKKFYNAIYQLKNKIATEGIKDFFEKTTNQSFKINTKYITKT